MGDSIIKDLAQLAGATDTTNGSWLVSFANELGVTSPVNGSWWEAIGLDLGLTAVNGSWIQAIAIHYGATDPVNGSWLQALYDNISFAPIFDPDAQAFITAASITDATQQGAVNQLVLDLKSASIWTKMVGLYPFVGGSASAHKWNLKDPRDLDAAYRLVFSGGITHSATGADPNGTNGFANTFLYMSSLDVANVHMSFCSRQNTYSGAGFACDVGSASGGGNQTLLSAGGTSTNSPASYFGATGAFGAGAANGFFVGSLTGGLLTGNTNTLYKNGSSIATSLNTLALSPNPFYIFASSGFPSYSNRECSFASIGFGLNGTEVTALTNAVTTFNTTLSR